MKSSHSKAYTSTRPGGDLDCMVEHVLRASRAPGAAVAVVVGAELAYAKGYGYCDLDCREPITINTLYPIASTTKAINATLLALLVGEGMLTWDEPVQSYLPGFRMHDEIASRYASLRDFILMRTGLPRHDWMWMGRPMSRADFVANLQHLAHSTRFREKFQYNNLTPTAAAYVAERVGGKPWEELVRQRLLEPLGMSNTTFGCPPPGNVTRSYHENASRLLMETSRLASEVIAPAGGSIHSTIEDMARWVSFNLGEGRAGGPPMDTCDIEAMHVPQLPAGTDPGAPSPDAAYGLGWFVDSYRGHTRISHGGYLHDVNSEIMLFPESNVGIISFINFGPPRLARYIGQCAFDWIGGLRVNQSVSELLELYEKKVEDNALRIRSFPRMRSAPPSHCAWCYTGTYQHPAYGAITITEADGKLSLSRYDIHLALEHWDYDDWVTEQNDLIPIHIPHAFDRSSRIRFAANADGVIESVSIRLEPEVDAVRFVRAEDR